MKDEIYDLGFVATPPDPHDPNTTIAMWFTLFIGFALMAYGATLSVIGGIK